MKIAEAIRLAVGTEVDNLDVIVTVASTPEQVDKNKPKKQAKQQWTQKLGITDTTGHTWAVVTMPSYKPIGKGWQIIIKTAKVDIFTNKKNEDDKRLLVDTYEIPTQTVDEYEASKQKSKSEGVLDPLYEKILAKYEIPATEALWPLVRFNKAENKQITQWLILHRYCEQLAAKANIEFSEPTVVVNDVNEKGKRTAVLFVKAKMYSQEKGKFVEEWTYGEATPENTFLDYVFAIAEKRAKDRLVLKLLGFHGNIYSDVEADWENE
jgi:hypothetical protein